MGEFDAIIKDYNLACYYKDMDNFEQCISHLKKAVKETSIMVEKLESGQTQDKHLLFSNKVELSHAKEKNLSKQLHVMRYNTKFTLQVCAMLSQIEKHKEAYEFSLQGTKTCRELLKRTLTLMMHHINKFDSKHNKSRDVTSKYTEHSSTKEYDCDAQKKQK